MRSATAGARASRYTNVFGAELAWELELPAQFDAAAEHVRAEQLCGPVLVSADLGKHAMWLDQIAELDADALYQHHVGPEQQRFIDVFGERVVPEVIR